MSTEYLAIGAPRYDNFDGKVLIYPIKRITKSGTLVSKYIWEVSSETPDKGEYFGASLVAIDINGDTRDELIIGAPIYSYKNQREIGRIYVYLRDDEVFSYLKKFLIEKIIFGHKSGGRFGTALSSCDVNIDSYIDVIVGAPYEQNNHNSMGAIYIYFGSDSGLDTNNFQRIGSESLPNVIQGFGISIASNTDFDANGYNDILVGSYLSENAVLLRTKPIATLNITNISFEPKRIQIDDNNCNNNQNSCFKINYCVQYMGKFIRDKQMILITVEITDRKVRELRAVLAKSNTKFEQKIVELKANQQNCFNNQLILNKPETLNDILTPIELKITVDIQNETTTQFCSDCAIAAIHSVYEYIDFNHGCQTQKCLSRLAMTAVSKYKGLPIHTNLIEGLHDTIDVEISVVNTGDPSLNTVLTIKMSPILLNLTNSAEAYKCKAIEDISAYKCNVSRRLQKGRPVHMNLHFIVSKVTTNALKIDFQLNSNSEVERNSRLTDSMSFQIIRKASLTIFSDTMEKFSFSDKTRRVAFDLPYNLVKSGPSSVTSAFIDLQLPHNIIVPSSESHTICDQLVSAKSHTDFPIVNKTLDLNCEKSLETKCSTFSCRLPDFNSGDYNQPFILSLSLIPYNIKHLEFSDITLKITSQIKVKENIKYETPITSSTTTTIYMVRDDPIKDEVIKPWVVMVSSGTGLLVLILTIIVLIRYGFFRRKKLEEIEKIKKRISMKLEMYDINVVDLDEDNANNG
ncbi:integrin alpha-PS4-like [Oppia nitens]|uniref:integrin alpha-PS4-like n=1 Tax=Oppia nitens TaxID=1686743 RepID=UPI0023DAA1F4|nr:integrin alpha-PS4-like [Oppia nitens]